MMKDASESRLCVVSLVAFELSWDEGSKTLQSSLAFYMLPDAQATELSGIVAGVTYGANFLQLECECITVR